MPIEAAPVSASRPSAAPDGQATAGGPAPGRPVVPAGEEEERDTRTALWRGWNRRCPHCGEGRMFAGYLKVADRCPACGTELFHHRADDGPAYLTILIVGHILAPVLLTVYFAWRPNPLLLSLVLSVGCVALSLYLLPRLKGALVGLQWAKRMHGFSAAPDPLDAPDPTATSLPGRA